MPVKSIIILCSYHHMNTEKIAHAVSRILDAQITSPHSVLISELDNYDLIGFGSGIYSGRHHPDILRLADALPDFINKKSFIFSTSAITEKRKTCKDHEILRNKLQSKGMLIVDEFSCKGFNTNSFLKYFGGMNKGKPDSDDVKNAEIFAQKMLQG